MAIALVIINIVLSRLPGRMTYLTIGRSEDELSRPEAANILVVAGGHNILEVTETLIRGQRPQHS